MNLARNLVIGVDAGGTKTTAWLAERSAPDAAPLGVGQGGPGNLRAVGFAAACAEYETALSMAFRSASIPASTAACVCLCVAGAGRPAEQQQLRQWAETKQLAEQIVVTGDAEPVLAAASSENVGIALICGTGSLAWGRNAAGQTGRVGGWGYLFGDEGSGYAIAVAGLRAAAHAADGRSSPTKLLPLFMKRLGASEPSQLIEQIYGSGLNRQQIAGMADIVFAAAKDDQIAGHIVQIAATDMAVMVSSLREKLHLPDSRYDLALAGGVLMHQPTLRVSLCERLKIDEQRVFSVPEPVAGAVALARTALQT